MRKYLILIIMIVLVSCHNTSIKNSAGNNNSQNKSSSISTDKENTIDIKYKTWENIPLVIIGYKNQNPVFRSWKSKTLFILKDSLEVYKTFSDSYKPLFINDQIIIFTEERSLIIYTDTNEIKISIEEKALDATATEDGNWIYFYTDYNKPIQILNLIDKSIVTTELIGWHIHIYMNHLYYAIEHPKKSGDVIVYRAKLPNLDNKELLIPCVFEEGLTFLPSDTLIGVNANLIREIRPAVFNINTKKYAFIDEITSDLMVPVLIPNRNKIGYYSLNNFNCKYFELKFDFKTAKELNIAE